MTDDKEKVWERLKHVPRRGVMFAGDLDVNSMYGTIMHSFNRKELEAKDCVNIRVLKNR